MLTNRHLLVLSETAGVRSVALADPALLQRWPLLRERIEADRAFLIWRLSLAASVESWKRSDGDESALLRGRLLEEAIAFVRGRSNDLSPAESAFIDESQAAAARRATAAAEEEKRIDALMESLNPRTAIPSPMRWFGISMELWISIGRYAVIAAVFAGLLLYTANQQRRMATLTEQLQRLTEVLSALQAENAKLQHDVRRMPKLK